MIKKICLNILFFCLLANTLSAQEKLSKSDIVKLDFRTLAVNKKKIELKDVMLIPAYRQLLKEADGLLNYKPVSVMQKTEFPPSGDKHDYMSIGPYWWPDPSKPNGLPYIRKDGEVNPEVHNYPDKENMPTLCENVYLLSLAYYFSNDEKYAEHAGKLIQVWFLDPATKMNPNLNYGQAIKGVINGRAEGLIDSRHFIYLIDGIGLIKKSKSWPAKNQTAIKQWFSQFLNWMQTNSIGLDELNAKNNHGVWYDAQDLAIALFIDSNELANKIVLRTADRLDKQMDDSGYFPLELERTTSLHYSVFIMNAFNIVAQLSEKTNTDFWTLKTKSGKTFKKAFETIEPFIAHQKQWNYKEIRPFNSSDAYPLLLMAGRKYNCNDCLEIIKNENKDDFEKMLINLL